MLIKGQLTKGICSVIGGFLIHLTLGTFYTIGNMNTYMTSYLRKYSNPNLTYASSIWFNTGFITGMGIIASFAGMLDRKIGTTRVCAIGCAIFTISTALTFFSIKQSFPYVVITYGVIPGIGSGITYAAPLVNSMKWFPANKGMVTGITVGGFGLGALIFDQVQTLYLNPHNYSPDPTIKYFVRNDILNKVPQSFLVFSGIYIILQIIGILMIFRADKHIEHYRSSEQLPNTVEDSQIRSDISPKNALKSRTFYILWILFSLGSQTVPFISALYKNFGLTFIKDDHYLAIVGSMASLLNAAGRIAWGKLMDKYNFKDCIITLFGALSILMFTFIMTNECGKILYTLWVILIFFTFSGIFSLFPAVVTHCYGATNANTIYGMLFTGPALTGIFGALILEVVIDNFGWFFSFFTVGIMSFAAMVIAMIFYRN